MAMLYLEAKADLEHFLEFNPGGLNKGATGLLNKAVRYIVNEYQGKWRHLYLRDQSLTLDATGYEIDVPADCNVLHFLARQTEAIGLYHASQFYIKVASPSALTSAVSRVYRFWDKQAPSGTVYGTYWRSIKEFADSTTEQYPDIPGSGQAILDTAKWLGLKEKSSASEKKINFWRGESQTQIRDLKAIDASMHHDRTAVKGDLNTDTHYATTYNPGDGGYTRPGGYTGPSGEKDPTL